MVRKYFSVVAVFLLIVSVSSASACKERKEFEPEPYYAPEKWVTIQGVNTCYLEAGRGEALIFVHGWCGNAFNFMDVFEGMAEDYHVFVIDLPGSGKSGCGEDIDYDVAFYADFVEEFMDRFGIDKAHLVGHSMGGQIVATFALRHPERLDRLVLVDSSGAAPGSGLMRAGSKLMTPALVIPMIHLIFPFDREKVEKSTIPLSEKKRVFLAEERYASNVRACTTEALSESMKSVVRDTLADRLSGIKAETLVVWCEDDDLVPLEAAHVFDEKIPDSELVIIKSCGHTPMQCRPEQFNTALKNFLAQQ